MTLSPFLHELFEHGHVRLRGAQLEFAQDDIAQAGGILAERERAVAADFPTPRPTLNLHAAVWAARQFYCAAFLLMRRDVSIEDAHLVLAELCPADDPPALHYAVDLTFQFLPDLDRLAGALSPQDPLRELLRERGAEWPLSSVGIKKCIPRRTDELLAHTGMSRAYVDRIIQRRDVSRMVDDTIRKLVLAALGQQRQELATWCNAAALAAATSSEKI